MHKRLVILALLILPLLATATIIEVPADYGTIQEAIDASSAGDTVLVVPGTYYGGFVISDHHLTLASSYIFSHNDNAIDNTILDGGGSEIVISMEDLGETPTSVIGFTIQNGLGEGEWPDIHGGGIDSGSSTVWVSRCRFISCVADNRGGGIYVGGQSSYIGYSTFTNCEASAGAAISTRIGTSDLVIERCEVFDNVCTAAYYERGTIQVSYSHGVTLYRNSIHHNDGAAYSQSGSDDCIINHCTITDNTTYGAVTSFDDDELTITNSIVFGADGFDGVVQNEPASTMICTYSDIGNGEGNDWYGEGCFDEDPMFEDPEDYNYYLSEGSPCIDAGDPESEWDPDETLPDIGARFGSGPSAVSISNSDLPHAYRLSRIYPNPFNGSATVSVSLPVAGELTVMVYNMAGQAVATLHDGSMNAGSHNLTFNASHLASGLYFVQAIVPGQLNQMQKVMLVK